MIPIAPSAIADHAAAQALRAAYRAGVVIEEVSDAGELARITRLYREVWGRAEDVGLGPETLRALAHAGGYVAVARRGGELVGALVGMLAMKGNPLYLHSHVLGVSERARQRGIGFALKQHQRAWALARGLTRVTWTFDPAIRANGFFNVTKLGADIDEYLVDFYGPIQDAINAGASDRVLMAWELQSTRAAAAADALAVEPDLDALLAQGAARWLEETRDGRPHFESVRAETVLCRVPADVVALRRGDPVLARDWRLAVREAFARAMESGYRTKGMTRSGWYVFAREG